MRKGLSGVMILLNFLQEEIKVKLISVELYALVEHGDIEFNKVEVSCMTFIKYPHIEKYSDD